jgi:ethanolamine transporter EutH
MKKIVWTFGLVAGAILGAMTVVMTVLGARGSVNFDHAEILGYTIMVLAFVLVFFGIRSYRENVAGGAISFGRAFQVGILVTLVASAVYVLSWEIVYFNVVPDFGDKYAAHTLEKMRAQGESPQAIEAATKKMAEFKEMYRNPVYNAGLTFLEVFPVGLVVTLVSAGILRKRAAAAFAPPQATLDRRSER